MGFPLGYSELFFPRIILQIFFLLAYVRRLVAGAFDAVGLSGLRGSGAPHSVESRHIGGSNNGQKRLIREILPVERYEDVAKGDGGHATAGECAVCLYDFKCSDKVRWLTNCRHIFHRCCLDRWMEYDQHTCPLCRSPLFMENDGCFWGIARVLDDAVADENYFSSLPSFGSVTDLISSTS